MKVLVSGGTGFIGRYVCEELVARGHHPTALSRTRFARQPDTDVRLGDVRDYTAVSEAMAHADGWIHLAGVLGTQETVADPWPAIDTNLRGAYNMLEAAAKYHLPGVNIAVGNWWMNNPYSITKNLAERLSLMYRDERGTPLTVVRAMNAYGPRQSVAFPFGASKVRKIVPSFVCRALLGEDIEVYGDGKQVMDMAYVRDVARVLVLTLEKTAASGPAPHVLEAGPGRHTSVLDVAHAVVEAAGSRSALTHLPMRPGEPAAATVLADCDSLGWLGEPVPFLPLAEGVEKTVGWYRENWLPGYQGLFPRGQ